MPCLISREGSGEISPHAGWFEPKVCHRRSRYTHHLLVNVWKLSYPLTNCGGFLFLLHFFFFFFLLLLLLFHFFFIPPKFYQEELSVTFRQIVMKPGDMVDMDEKLCKKVSKFKMSDSKAGQRACPKLPNISH